MAFSIKNAGAWSDVKGISVKDAGTWKTVQNGYIKKAGTWVEFFANATVLTVTTTVTNYNLFTAAGSPTQPVNVILNINSGATIGATAGNTALTVGQFPTGSTITINNSGSIIGYGGSAGTSGAGGSGGDAINANYANQTVTINNLASSFIYAGGGGGGKGGTGGGGQYSTPVGTGQTAGAYDNGCSYPCSATYGGGWYCVNNECGVAYYDAFWFTCYNCGYDAITETNGGTGGNGGLGQGYSQTNSSESTGAAGGTNAGTGGTGGNGGTYGSNGSTGSTGANGNRTSGSAGSSGGIAGRYLVKGTNSVTLNNSGTVAGGIA